MHLTPRLNLLLFQGSQDSSVGIVPSVLPEDQGFDCAQRQDFWILRNVHTASGAPNDRLSSPSAKVNREWGSTSTPSAHFHATTGIVTVKTTHRSHSQRHRTLTVDTNVSHFLNVPPKRLHRHTARDSLLSLVTWTRLISYAETK